MTGRARFPFAAAVATVILAATMALAERPHVVILGPAADHPAVERMRGELAMLGVDVDVVVQARDASNLEALARRLGAAAALRVGTAPPAIVLWVDPAAAVPGAAAPQAEVRIGGPAEERDPGLLALRAVEVLRARLIRVPIADAAPAALPVPADRDAGAATEAGLPVEAQAEPSPPGTAPPSPTPPREGVPKATAWRPRPVGLSAGPAVLLSPGGVPAAFHVRIGAEWDPIPRVGVEAMAFVPVTAGTVAADEGSIDLRVLALGGGARVLVTDPASDFAVALGLGVDAVMLTFSGKAEAPWAGESGNRWAAAPYAAVTAGYRFHPRFSLRLDLVTMLVRPEPVVRLAGRDVASFGQPAMIPSLGVEVRP